MDAATDLGGSMPTWLLYPATLAMGLVLVLLLIRGRSVAARFALFALCFRNIASANHAIAFLASPVGLSWNALGSSGVFALGLLFIRVKNLLIRQMVPVYILIGVVTLSGVANHDPRGVIDVVIKLGYFAIITLAVYEGLEDLGERRMMKLLLWAFLLPFVLQVASVALGVVKASESDGSTSYIGGYSHEAAFSVILMTCFVVACFASGLRPFFRISLLIVCLGAILLANYRTAILALAPLAVAQFNLDIISRFSHRQRIGIGVVLLAVSIPILIGAAWLIRERFADLAVVMGNLDNLIKRPEQYTFEEARLLSGRAYLWSQYISGYLEGDGRNLLLGFGPNAWADVFAIYAHNTLVSTLYEYGILGVLAMLGLWGSMFWAACRIQNGPRGKVIAAHITFLLLNMATMPHWMLEGNILYGVICGYTLHLFLRRRPALSTQEREESGVLPAKPQWAPIGPSPMRAVAAPRPAGRRLAPVADLRGMVTPPHRQGRD